jgi:hypothetical protein
MLATLFGPEFQSAYALKGQHMVAQGAALGRRANERSKL